MKFEIKSRFSGRVLFTAETESIKLCVEAAVKARAYLADANLAGANLAGAYLADADLADANLADANLADANLADANLARAYLADANLADANLARAYLADANLADANLADANLARAYLAGAYLAGADLARANLAGAYLADANLADANLARAYLADANLARAYMADANLARAYMADANLADADLADANLAGAYLADAKNVPTGITAEPPTEPYERKPSAERRAEHAARYRERHPEVPVVEALDAKLLQIIESGAGNLNMSTWHTCETTHCRAGWAIHLAGSAGADLEAQFGPQRAGAMIYRASTGRVPHFFASDERALKDIREQAQQQGAQS